MAAPVKFDVNKSTYDEGKAARESAPSPSPSKEAKPKSAKKSKPSSSSVPIPQKLEQASDCRTNKNVRFASTRNAHELTELLKLDYGLSFQAFWELAANHLLEQMGEELRVEPLSKDR